MRTRTSLGLAVAAGVAAIATLAEPAHGGGFELRPGDAKAAALSHAFTATADTPAALAHNPAGMSQLDGLQGSATLAVIDPHIHFSPANPAEGSANNDSNPGFVPSVFGTAEITDYLHFGIGTFAPFGTNVKWEDDWSGRYISTWTRIQTIEVNPTVSLKLPLPEGNTLAIAGGMGIVRSDLRLRQNIDFSSTGNPDGFARLHADTDDHLALTWDAGLLVTVLDRKVRFGAMYRYSVDDVHAFGTAEFFRVPINPLTGQPALPPATKVKARLTYPMRFKTGLAVQPIDPLLIEFDFAWTDWSRLDRVFVDFHDIGRSAELTLHWRDSYYYSLGVEYKLVPDMLAGRFGVFYDGSPRRRATDSPAIPDNDRRGFSLGVGVTPIPALAIDLAYTAVFLKTLEKDNDIGADKVVGGNPRANGTLQTFANVFAVTFGLKF